MPWRGSSLYVETASLLECHVSCRSRLVCLWLTALTAGCGNSQHVLQATGGRSAYDLAAVCDSALAAETPAPILRSRLHLVPKMKIESNGGNSLGSVLGFASPESAGKMLVLDGLNARVRLYDRSGRYLGSIGGHGGGPGELEFLGGPAFKFNQLAWLPKRGLLIRSLVRVDWFRPSGRFVMRREIEGGKVSGRYAVPQIAPISDSTALISQTGAFDVSRSDRKERTALNVYKITLQDDSIGLQKFVTVRNQTTRLPRFTTYPTRDPFSGTIERTWDAIASGLFATASLSQHGACFVGNDGTLISAYRVDAPVVPVDAVEKEWMIAEKRRRFGPTAPIVGQSWNKLYSWWPATIPVVSDVVLAPDSTLWLERPLAKGKREIDLINARRGYLGTIESPTDSMPVGFQGSCPLFIQTTVPTRAMADSNGYYGLESWCPAPEE